MKNIYDIISEQQAIVNVNIASYDLGYTIKSLDNDNLYLSEGVGENIKNAIDKIIAFAKNMISKIKELIARVIRYITGGNKDKVTALNKKVEAANNGGGESVDDTISNIRKATDESRKETDRLKKERAKREREAEEEKRFREKERMKRAQQREQERRKNIKNEYKKASNVHEVVQNSRLQVETTYFPPLEKKIELTNKFFDAFDRTRQEFGKKRIADYDIFVGTVVDRTFDGSSGGKMVANRDRGDTFAADLEKRVRLYVNESGKDVRTYFVSTISTSILSYLDNGAEAVKYLQGKEKAVVNELNKMIRELEDIKSGRTSLAANGEDYDVQPMYLMVKEAVSLVGTFTNIMVKLVVSSNQKAFEIANKAVDHYVEEVRAKYSRK